MLRQKNWPLQLSMVITFYQARLGLFPIPRIVLKEEKYMSIKDLLKNLADGLYDGERTDSEMNGVSS